jgi:hypothetical protein
VRARAGRGTRNPHPVVIRARASVHSQSTTCEVPNRPVSQGRGGGGTLESWGLRRTCLQLYLLPLQRQMACRSAPDVPKPHVEAGIGELEGQTGFQAHPGLSTACGSGHTTLRCSASIHA